MGTTERAGLDPSLEATGQGRGEKCCGSGSHPAKRRLRSNSGNSCGEGIKLKAGEQGGRGRPRALAWLFQVLQVLQGSYAGLAFFSAFLKSIRACITFMNRKKKKKTFLTSKWLPALRVRPDSKSGSQSTVSAAHQASSQSSLGLTPPPQGLPTLAFRQCPLPRFTGREKDGLGPLSGLGREESYHRRGEVQTSGTQPASWCKAETDKPVKVTSQSPRASLWSQDPQPGPRMLSMSSSTGYTTALESAVGPRAIRSLRAMSH